MFKLFKNKKLESDNKNIELVSKTASLLIHAAKIDEKYTDKEKDIIKNTLIEIGAEKKNIDKIIFDAETNEQKSNQILNFTRQIKNADEKFKIKVIESMWKIIYSNNEADMYENNLMRRISGLLYLDDKIVGSIKEKIRKNLF